jgi:hypothetical protein
MTEDEKDREALARRMRDAIEYELTREDDRVVEEIFRGRGARSLLLGAIADLAESLIVYASYAGGDCNWREMVGEVHGEMLKWVWELENC